MALPMGLLNPAAAMRTLKGPFNFYFGREFGQYAPVAFERSRREEDANFQSWIGVARSLPGTDKSAGLQDELAFGRAVFTGALARSFAEPAADVESVLSRDGFHPLAENIDYHADNLDRVQHQ